MQVFDDNPCRPHAIIRWLAGLLAGLRLLNDRKYQNRSWDSGAEYLQFKWLRIRFIFARKRFKDLKRTMDSYRATRKSDQDVEAVLKTESRVESVQEFDRHCRLLPPEFYASATEVTFRHSGHAGDLIYSLPVVRALSRGKPARLFLKLNDPIGGWTEKEHPLGKLGLTPGLMDFLKPLLTHESWRLSVQSHQDEPVDYDLNLIRKVPGGVGRGNISHWYFWIFPTSANLSVPWLECRLAGLQRGKIVLARSSRYRNPYLDYAFLRRYGEIDFIGHRAEFEDMQRVLPQLRHVECTDALHLANVIQSARFFIGNQSFPFSVAEGLKARRILEVYPLEPNVIPEGGVYGVAYFQTAFESLVGRFWEETAG